jgi:hypothetical protein
VREGTCTYPALQTKMQLKTKELLKKSDAYSEKKAKVMLYYCLFEIVFSSSFFGDNIVGRIISHHD